MAPAQKVKQGHHFEFFGPYLGPIGILLGLPAVCYGLVFACNASGCLSLAPQLQVPGFPAGQRFFTAEALAAVLGWFAFQLLLHVLLPGRRRQGTVLADGSRMTYKLNGACGVRGAAARSLARSLAHRPLTPWPRRSPAPAGACRPPELPDHGRAGAGVQLLGRVGRPGVGVRQLRPPHDRGRPLQHRARGGAVRGVLCGRPPAGGGRQHRPPRVRLLHRAGAQPPPLGPRPQGVLRALPRWGERGRSSLQSWGGRGRGAARRPAGQLSPARLPSRCAPPPPPPPAAQA